MEFQNLPIEDEESKFKEHLILENNNRIILSGIFGIGKTYFINEFFKRNENDYIEIRLNPVNYSVSATEDIFELIKFDIGLQLFKENPNFEKIDLGNYLATEYFFLNNFQSLIEKLITKLSKLDQNLNFVAKPILELRRKIIQFRESNKIDDKNELKSFLEEFTNKSGTIREENGLTVLISFLLQTLKHNHPTKKTVLVIDDLDRIDPEHIFRILNIFSAHFDYYNLEGKNKFGFDKVILICDIDNIRGIFYNRYGTNIDFTGYIDKFYSIEIFEYQFSKVIIASFKKFFSSINSSSNIVQAHIQQNFDSYYSTELAFILEYFINSNSLSMRNLIAFLKNKYVPSDLTIKGGRYNIHTNSTPILLIFDILIKLYGGIGNLFNAIDRTINKFPLIEMSTYNSYWNLRLGNLIMLLDYKSSDLKPTNKEIEYSTEEFDIKVIYQIESHNYGIVGETVKIGDANSVANLVDMNHYAERRLPYFQILRKALKVFEHLPKNNVK